MSVVLVNPFVVYDGREEQFLSLWDQTNALFKLHPGYISARLVKSRPQQMAGQMPPFTHINIAEWESAEAYGMALMNPMLLPLMAGYAAVCTLQPALYDEVRNDERGG